MKWESLSLDALTPGLPRVTAPAQRLKVMIIIRSAIGLCYDVVYTRSDNSLTFAKMFLAQTLVTLQDTWTYHVPLAAVASLVA